MVQFGKARLDGRLACYSASTRWLGLYTKQDRVQLRKCGRHVRQKEENRVLNRLIHIDGSFEWFFDDTFDVRLFDTQTSSDWLDFEQWRLHSIIGRLHGKSTPDDDVHRAADARPVLPVDSRLADLQF